jgi:diadenosine tetraphosphate (Ap4A) HIT family hydrolase
MPDCIFCHRENLEIIAENEMALAFPDICPVSRGHTLVIPKRHIETYFNASLEEHAAISSLVGQVRQILDQKYSPDGYNIGANVGPAAGQTVFHFHLHVIPRYRGDVADPRGGVRKVIPNYSCHRLNNVEDQHRG